MGFKVAVDGTIPNCLGPHSKPSRPVWKLPEGAWDTHFHVLGPQSKFSYAPNRKYSPPDAPLNAALQLQAALGISRGFVVHANTHGFDNSVDLDAVARSGGRYFAVVRLDDSVTPAACRALHQAGARGVRFAFNPQHGGSLNLRTFDHVMHCIEGLGWFVELHFESKVLVDLEGWLKTIPAPVVIDHIGRIDPSAGITQKPFGVLLRLLQLGKTWIKISGIDRISRVGFPYTDVDPFVKVLVNTDPAKLLWGSDWPHTGVFDPAKVPDDGGLLDAFARFVPDGNLRNQILVHNPPSLLNQDAKR